MNQNDNNKDEYDFEQADKYLSELGRKEDVEDTSADDSIRDKISQLSNKTKIIIAACVVAVLGLASLTGVLVISGEMMLYLLFISWFIYIAFFRIK